MRFACLQNFCICKDWSEPVDTLYYMDATVLWGNGFFNSFTDRDTHNSVMHDMAVRALFEPWTLASAHACGIESEIIRSSFDE